MKLILEILFFATFQLFLKICAGDGVNLHFQQMDYQLKFERVELVRYNKSFLKDVSIVTFKYNRTIAVINATFTLKHDLGRNSEVIVQAYKFMSNEYRHFPLRFEYNSCKAIEANTGGLSRFLECGNFTGCPMMKGKHHICNWYPDQSKFPPFIPDGQYMVQLQNLHFSNEIAVINGYVTVFRPIV